MDTLQQGPIILKNENKILVPLLQRHLNCITYKETTAYLEAENSEAVNLPEGSDVIQSRKAEVEMGERQLCKLLWNARKVAVPCYG